MMTLAVPAALPSGEREWASFIDTLAEVDDSIEDHWLELKSEVDLSKADGRAKVTKFILGAANRLPSVARGALGGYAIMVIGVAHGSKPGIPRIENHELDRVLKPFFGQQPPRWDYTRLDADDNRQILVVVVAPPADGDPVFICRKSSGDLTDGAIYVRARGETRVANAAELDGLMERASAGGPVVDFDVQVVGTVRAYKCDHGVLEEFIESERARLLASLPAPTPTEFKGFTNIHRAIAESYKPAVHALGGTYKPENRSNEDFRTELAEYLDACHGALPDLVDGVIAHFGSPSKIVVQNGPSAFLRNVEIELHLEGPIDMLEVEDPEYFSTGTYLPKPPQEFGDKHVPYTLAGLGNLPSTSLSHLTPRKTGPTADWSNSGSVTVHLTSFDIRPESRLEFDENAVLTVRDSEVSSIACSWKATADGFHQAFRGEFTLEVDEPLDITEYVRSLFQDPDETT